MLLCGSETLAQTAPSLPSATTPSVTDPESLAIARQIAAIALTHAKTDQYVERVELWVLHMAVPRWVADVSSRDAAMSSILENYFDQAKPVVHAALIAKLPELNIGASRAYARMFSRTELIAILTFAKTPAGTKFLSGAAIVGKEEEVAKSTLNFAYAGLASQKPLQMEMQTKLRTYLVVHPELASKIETMQEFYVQQRGIDLEAALAEPGIDPL